MGNSAARSPEFARCTKGTGAYCLESVNVFGRPCMRYSNRFCFPGNVSFGKKTASAQNRLVAVQTQKSRSSADPAAAEFLFSTAPNQNPSAESSGREKSTRVHHFDRQ